MNVLYILGNGFDLAQGMKTSYPNFYDNCLSDVTGSPLLEELKKVINTDRNNWSDMEEAFGLYTKNLKSEDDFKKLYLELRRLLTWYLNIEDESFNPSYEQKRKIVEDFANFTNYLGKIDKRTYDQSVHSYIDDGINPYLGIRVMTYNYTHTLEKLLEPFSDGTGYLNSRAKLEQIIHVHGTLKTDDAIIFGVDNEKQIANEPFRTNDNVKDFLVKNQSNLSMNFDRSLICEDLIRKANIIIIYGVSIGETDNRWWKLIGEQIKQRNDLIIIHFVYKVDILGNPNLLMTGNVKREMKDKLMGKFGFNNNEDAWRKIVKERLFFVVNTKAFKER